MRSLSGPGLQFTPCRHAGLYRSPVLMNVQFYCNSLTSLRYAYQTASNSSISHRRCVSEEHGTMRAGGVVMSYDAPEFLLGYGPQNTVHGSRSTRSVRRIGTSQTNSEACSRCPVGGDGTRRSFLGKLSLYSALRSMIASTVVAAAFRLLHSSRVHRHYEPAGGVPGRMHRLHGVRHR